MSVLSPNDMLRWTWTLVTGFGTLAMLVLLREVVLDNEAIQRTDRPGVEVARLIAKGEIADQLIRLGSIAALFIAGVASLYPAGVTGGDIALVMLIASAFAQVVLGTVKLNRRRQLFRQIRIDRTKGHS